MLMWSSTSIRRGILFNIHAEYSACPRLLVSVLAIYATTFRPMFPWKILCLTQPETQKILLTHIPHVCNGPPLQICARDTSARDSLALSLTHSHTYTHTPHAFTGVSLQVCARNMLARDDAKFGFQVGYNVSRYLLSRIRRHVSVRCRYLTFLKRTFPNY